MKNIDLLNKEVAEIEIHYKTNVKASERKTITASKDCADIFLKIFDYNTIEYREYFYAMYLSRSSKILAVLQISAGGISGTVVDMKMILQGALKLNATNIIVCHNHPSGNVEPSEADIKLSKKLKDAAIIMDLRLIDSLIINSEGAYTSLADEGIL